MPSALLLPVLTCAAVLLVSGVTKLRAPQTVDAAFTSLAVPRALDTAFVRRLSPLAEVALGVGLLLASGRALVAVAALTLALFVAYLVLVVRAVRRPEPVDCGCFGALGDSTVTRVTVWRNGALVLSAALCVVAGLRDVALGRGLADRAVLAWIAAATLTATVAVLVAYRAPVTATSSAEPHHDPDLTYERQRTPQAEVLTQEGRLVLLSNETAAAAHLLVFLSPGCGPCGRLGPDLADWSEQLDPVVVRAVVIAQPGSGSAMPYLTGHAWYDPYGMARTAFGVTTPAAVLVGTDGMLAGGPVQGEDDVRALVTELGQHLREVRGADQPLGSEREGVSDAR
jgi:hypothetical protein